MRSDCIGGFNSIFYDSSTNKSTNTGISASTLLVIMGIIAIVGGTCAILSQPSPHALSFLQGLGARGDCLIGAGAVCMISGVISAILTCGKCSQKMKPLVLPEGISSPKPRIKELSQKVEYNRIPPGSYCVYAFGNATILATNTGVRIVKDAQLNEWKAQNPTAKSVAIQNYTSAPRDFY